MNCLQSKTHQKRKYTFKTKAMPTHPDIIMNKIIKSIKIEKTKLSYIFPPLKTTLMIETKPKISRQVKR